MDKNIWLEFHHVKEFCEDMEDVAQQMAACDSLEETIVMAWESECGYTPSPYSIAFVMKKAREVIEEWEIQRELDRQIAEIADEMQREERVRRATERITGFMTANEIRETFVDVKVNDAKWSNPEA